MSSASSGKPGELPEYSESALVDEFEQKYGQDLSHVKDHWNIFTGKLWRADDKIVFDYIENVARRAAERALRGEVGGEAIAIRVASARTFAAIDGFPRIEARCPPSLKIGTRTRCCSRPTA